MDAKNFTVFGLCALFVVITTVIYGQFNSAQQEPYMDEIFHIPQAQNYCVGNFSNWNNKITTLPGLYIVSMMQMQIQTWMPFIGGKLQEDQPCTTQFLRFANVMFMLLNLWLLYELSFLINFNHISKLVASKADSFDEKRKRNKMPKKTTKISSNFLDQNISKDKPDEFDFNSHAFANAFVLSFFPLLYFFTFLYYTDQGSTAMVLLMYWFSLQENHMTAALTGAVAVCFRQTNIIWVIFVAGVSLLRGVEDFIPDINNGIQYFISEIIGGIKSKFREFFTIAFAYLCIGVAFGIFIIKNDGVVVGDRSSHQACFHVPQLFYFIGFTICFSFSLFFSKSSLNVAVMKAKEVMQNKFLLFMLFSLFLLMMIVVSKLTYVHEYLLADNRHYPFYIWRKVFERHWSIKYIAIPVYMYGAFIMQHLLGKQTSALFVLFFSICTMLVTVPQKLLEFRYFIIPYLLFRLHVKLPSYTCLAVELALYSMINVFTIMMFLYKPFFWNSGSVERFMW